MIVISGRALRGWIMVLSTGPSRLWERSKKSEKSEKSEKSGLEKDPAWHAESELQRVNCFGSLWLEAVTFHLIRDRECMAGGGTFAPRPTVLNWFQRRSALLFDLGRK